MSFRIKSDARGRNYARFLRKVREAIAVTYSQQAEEGYTRSAMAAVLEVDRSVISKRLSGLDNITLKTVADIYFAMGREPLENFEATDSKKTNIAEDNRVIIQNNYIYNLSSHTNNFVSDFDDVLNTIGISPISSNNGQAFPNQRFLVGSK